MANLVEYLSFPIRKLFNTPEFKAAAKKEIRENANEEIESTYNNEE